MEKVVFRCLNCGNRVEKDLLPGKHTILGTLPIVNREATCCESPEYEDNKGYRRSLTQRSLTNIIPGVRA